MTEPPVVNASPLIYLAHAGFLDLLQTLGPVLLVPQPVAEEILRRGPGDPTARALNSLPWLRLVEPPDIPAKILDWDLGPGEASVLSWAFRYSGTLAVLDDLAGRRCAETLEISLIGTLGIVLKAKRTGRISAARPVMKRLIEVGMYLSDGVLNKALSLVGE